jgi:parallel beta-helix repeat protein
VAIGNGANGNDAFLIQGSSHTVSGNEARNNARGGFGIHGSDHIVTGNLASNNLQGAEVTSSGQFTRNAIVGNNLDGLIVNAVGKELLIRRNDILDNGQHGVRILNPFDGIITRNNIFGNASTAGNCGLLNQSGGPVNAIRNFWGAPSGPGPDPADEVCDELGSTTIVDPVARKEFNIPTAP